MRLAGRKLTSLWTGDHGAESWASIPWYGPL
jgi:hypothetical protein